MSIGTVLEIELTDSLDKLLTHAFAIAQASEDPMFAMCLSKQELCRMMILKGSLKIIKSGKL